MPSCMSNIKEAGPTGRLSVCLVVTGLIMVIQVAILIPFSGVSNFQFALIGVAGDILLIGASVCVHSYIKGKKQSNNPPSFVRQVN